MDALKGGVNDWLGETFGRLLINYLSGLYLDTFLSIGSHVASCDPITTSYAAFPRRNCTHMVEIPVPFNPEGKTLVREILALVGSVPEARLEEQ